MYDVLRKITLKELNIDELEVGRAVLTLQLVGIKTLADLLSTKGNQGQFNYKLKTEETSRWTVSIYALFCNVNNPNDLCCYGIEFGSLATYMIHL